MNLPLFLTEKKLATHFSVPLRIYATIFIALTGFSIAVSIYVQAFSDDIYAVRKQGLENIVSLAQNSIEPIIQDKQSGNLSLGDARLKTAEIINKFTYYHKGAVHFVFLTTYEGYVLVEPPFPETVGTYQMQRRDAAGTPVTRRLLEKARAGGGFVEYYEAKAVGDKPQKKIAYVVGLPEIECFLGTGIYVYDIDQSIDELKQKLILLGFLIIVGILTLQYFVMRPLFRCVSWLSGVFKHLGENPESLNSVHVPLRVRNTEADMLISGLNHMINNLNSYQQTIKQNAQKFQQIALASNDIIWEWSSEKHCTQWSGDMMRLIGLDPDCMDCHFEVANEWVHPNDRKKRQQALAAYLAGSVDYYSCEYRLLNAANNEYTWVTIKGIATFSENRTPLHMVGSIVILANVPSSEEVINSTEVVSMPFDQLNPIGDFAQQTPSCSSDSLVIDVKKRLDTEQWPGIVIVDENKPVGLIMRDALNYQLSSQYGTSLYYARPIKILMDSQPLIVAADSPLEAAAAIARARPEHKLYDLIIVTKEGNYYGTVSVMELLSRITDLRILLAANANPLTGLPGNVVIEQKLKQAMQHYFDVLYIDLDNFKAFNDKYGFEMGDRALKLTARILRNTIDHYKDSFLGHIGGDDFVIVLQEPSVAVQIAEQIIKQFDSQIITLYSAEDLAARGITVLDRQGQIQSYPIMTISIALVESRANYFTNYLEISEVAAQLKKRAKMIDGSICVSERRTA